MPLALILLGVLFLTAAVRGNKCNGQQCSDLLFSTLKDDFTGPDNFIYWGLALFIIGAAGYYKPFKPLSNAFLGLVILVLFISNRGFFNKFMEQISSTTVAQSGASANQSIQANVGSIVSSILSGVLNNG
jgi:hypothetical protein